MRLPPKPHPRLQSKPWLSPERKGVTIVAGFRTHEGVVLCADTQETVSNLSKRNVSKLIFHPQNVHLMRERPGYLATAFCGAGDGPFLDMLVGEAWKAAQNATGLDDACAEITKTIEETYRKYGQIYQPGYCPTAELIFGIVGGIRG
jgi:hypothetical protein